MADKVMDEATRIRTVVQEHPLGLSIKEIAAEIGMSRNSVAKYLDVLTATGQLDLRHVGNAKLYTLSRRVPVEQVLMYSHELISVLDVSLCIVEASDSLCDFVHAPRETILGKRLSSPSVALLTTDDETQLQPLLAGGNISWKKEIRLQVGNDEIFFDGRFVPTILKNGESGITMILADITGRRRAEQAMQERDRLLQTIFRIPTVPRFFIDRNHKVVFWDRALEIMTDIRSEDIVGTDNHWTAFYPEKRSCLVDLLVDGKIAEITASYGGTCRKTHSVDGGYECTEFYPSAGPSGRWLHKTATVIRDPSGNLTGAMETLEDVTVAMQQIHKVPPSDG